MKLSEKLMKVLDILSKTGSILVPFILFYLGNEIKIQQEMDNKNQQNNNRITTLIRSFSSENAKERKIAISFSKYLAENDNFPNDLIGVFKEIIENDTTANSNEAQEAQQVLQTLKSTAEKANDAVLINRIDKSIASIKPRIYIHTSDNKFKLDMERLSDSLRAEDYIIPAIDVVKATAKSPELRYFKNAELEKAKELLNIIHKLGYQIELKYMSGSENSNKIRQYHFEIWWK